MSASAPVELPGAPAFVELSLGNQSSCGRTAADAVYCWGSNVAGRLGNGDTTGMDVLTPTAVPNTALTALDLGNEHGCGINAADQVVHCWGRGAMYRVGDGTEDDRFAPVPN